MKLAIIPPINYLEDFSTDYHLVLAHLYSSDMSYRAFYKSRRAVGEFIIMDNGAAELGASIAPEELCTLACDLLPNVLVCPDVLHNARATMAAFNQFVCRYARRLEEAGVALMAVPQGKTLTEWEHTYEWFNNDSTISWLGISKYAPVERLTLLKRIAASVAKKCHLLGMWEDMQIVDREKQFSFVASTDTAVPVKLGLQGLTAEGYSNGYQKMPDDMYFNWPRGLDKQLHNQVLANIGEYRWRCQ